MRGNQRMNLANANPQGNAALLHSPYYGLVTRHLRFKDELALASTSKKAMLQFINKWCTPAYMLAFLSVLSPRDYYIFREVLPSYILRHYEEMIASESTAELKRNQAYICWAFICKDINAIDTTKLAQTVKDVKIACKSMRNFPMRVFAIADKNIKLLNLARDIEKINDTFDSKVRGMFYMRSSTTLRALKAEASSLSLDMTNRYYYKIPGETLHRAQLKKKHLDEIDDFSGRFLAGVEIYSNTRALAPGRDISGKNFANANLNQALMQGCILSQTNFTGADLRGANLNGARMQNACFVDANLEGTSMFFEKSSNGDAARPIVLVLSVMVGLPNLTLNEARDQIQQVKENRFTGIQYFSSITDMTQLNKKLNMFCTIQTDRIGHLVNSVMKDLIRVVMRDLEVKLINAELAENLLQFAKNHSFITNNYFKTRNTVAEIDAAIATIVSQNPAVSGDIELLDMRPRKC